MKAETKRDLENAQAYIERAFDRENDTRTASTTDAQYATITALKDKLKKLLK